MYVVGADQRCVPVHLDVTQAYGTTLSKAFERVPLPADAHPAAGRDAHLTLIQPSTDSMWEFWELHKQGDQWHAGWGGAIHDVSSNPGYYTTSSWPGAQSNWGASATSLPVVAGTMTIGELESGHIDHALAITIPNARKGVFAFPGAAHGWHPLGDRRAIPGGDEVPLGPQLDVSVAASSAGRRDDGGGSAALRDHRPRQDRCTQSASTRRIHPRWERIPTHVCSTASRPASCSRASRGPTSRSSSRPSNPIPPKMEDRDASLRVSSACAARLFARTAS